MLGDDLPLTALDLLTVEMTRNGRAGTTTAAAEHDLATAWLDSDPDAAYRAAKLAIQVNHPVLAAGDRAAAELLQQGGHHTDTTAASSTARRWLAMGAVGDAERCTRIFGATRMFGGEPPLTRAAGSGPGALIRTERTVTELDAQGLKDADIARELGISRRPVETHVSSVDRKLDVSTRVAIARTALAHHIS